MVFYEDFCARDFTLIGQCLLLGPATILQPWWRQNSASDLHQVVRDVEAELLHVLVVVEVRFADQVVDFALAVGRASGGGLAEKNIALERVQAIDIFWTNVLGKL